MPTMTFDVASVRESKVNLEAGITVGGGFEQHSSMLRVNNFTLWNLLEMAYGTFYGVKGIPDDLGRAYFNVQAKADSDADAKLATLDKKDVDLEQEHMVQELLADRFKLKVHWETKEGPVYNLVVAKAGRLQSTGAGPSAEELKNWGDHPIPPLYQQGGSESGFHYIADGATTADIAEMLGVSLGGPWWTRQD